MIWQDQRQWWSYEKFSIKKSKNKCRGCSRISRKMVSGNAQRPGDIVKSYSGKTIEILNTDAEED